MLFPVNSVTGRGPYTEANTLRDHIAELHSDVKTLFCHCGKGFVLKHKLNAHQRDVHGEKTHICETCGKGWWYQSIHVINRLLSSPLTYFKSMDFYRGLFMEECL